MVIWLVMSLQDVYNFILVFWFIKTNNYVSVIFFVRKKQVAFVLKFDILFLFFIQLYMWSLYNGVVKSVKTIQIKN